MSAELIAGAPTPIYPQWAVQGPADDDYRLIYCVAGSCSECEATGLETYLGRCEACTDWTTEFADLLQPSAFNWPDLCQAGDCGGTVQYAGGLGRCDTCGTAHRTISTENYSKLFLALSRDPAIQP
jgi:hypothetical protein